MCPESESFQLQVLELWQKQSYNCRKPIGLVWEWGVCILHTVRPDDQIALQALTFSSNYNTAVFMKLSKVPLTPIQFYASLCREHTINTSRTSVSHTKQTERLDMKSILFCCQPIHTDEEKNVFCYHSNRLFTATNKWLNAAENAMRGK